MAKVKGNRGLIISVIVNALLIGLVLGSEIKYSHEISINDNNRNMYSKDNWERNYKYNEYNSDFVYGEMRGKIHNDEKVKDAHKNIEKALLTEPYDKQAILKAFEELNDAKYAVKKGAYLKIADKAEKLEPAERLALLPCGKRIHK